jgi:hypothetical protein
VQADDNFADEDWDDEADGAPPAEAKGVPSSAAGGRGGAGDKKGGAGGDKKDSKPRAGVAEDANWLDDDFDD